LPKNVIMPALGVAQETGRVVRWMKSDGEEVGQGELLLEIETDKATVELEAPASGVLMNLTAGPGDEVPVGTVIGKIWSAEELTQSAADLATATPTSRETALEENKNGDRPISPATTESRAVAESAGEKRNHEIDRSGLRGRVPSSPKARRLAAQRGINLNSLQGSGSDPIVASTLSRTEKPDAAPEDKPENSRIWRIMADRTAEAWKTIPHFYLSRNLDAGKLMDWRQYLRGQSNRDITLTDVLLKKVATCLRSHPYLNSEWRSGSTHRHQNINIGLAVAVDQGLVVPVIRDADRLTVTEIAEERSRLVEKAQAGKLAPDDISAGTFTISNLGMYGVDFFQAIVNPPQAAILGIGRITQRLVPIDNQPAVRPMMTLSISCDHRLVDGARAAKFIADLAAAIEQVALVEV
jgi:pyruvate dehydrogenase E2 component (dihydrolipoamide acetyltransferase)